VGCTGDVYAVNDIQFMAQTVAYMSAGLPMSILLWIVVAAAAGVAAFFVVIRG